MALEAGNLDNCVLHYFQTVLGDIYIPITISIEIPDDQEINLWKP